MDFSPLSLNNSEKIYIKVNSDFDTVGFMRPKSITWSDGRIFPIEQVRDFFPFRSLESGCRSDRYTVVISGQERYLFFEHSDSPSPTRFGRWFIKKAVQKGL